jgi:hypothetical protein
VVVLVVVVVQHIIWKIDSYSPYKTIASFLYGNRRLITVFKKARHWTVPWASWIHFAPSITSLPLRAPNQNTINTLPLPRRATCPAHYSTNPVSAGISEHFTLQYNKQIDVFIWHENRTDAIIRNKECLQLFMHQSTWNHFVQGSRICNMVLLLRSRKTQQPTRNVPRIVFRITRPDTSLNNAERRERSNDIRT